MLTRRIIPCFDVLDGRVVKHVGFLNNRRDAGNPVALAAVYAAEGADELVLLDISASEEGRLATHRIVEEVAATLNIPLTVGGGVNRVEDVAKLLLTGADKVSMNTGAVRNPRILEDAARRFGQQCMVVAIDAKLEEETGKYEVMIQGGKVPTGLEVVAWAKQVESLGAGEILLTSFRLDGTQSGFDLELTHAVSSAVHIPVIASGGAGCAADFVDVFKRGNADAALAASIFHFGQTTIREVKAACHQQEVPIRWMPV
jgi:imidazole glycerol-phosphate synthase subunit HisF